MEYDIKNIQEALYFCKFCPGEVDGVMGPNTEKAIKDFQSFANLSADGIVGPKTAAAIFGKLVESSVHVTTLKDYFEKSIK